MNLLKHILTVNLDEPVDTYPSENTVEKMKENRISHEDVPSVAYKPEPIFEPIQDNTISKPPEDIPITPPVPPITLEPKREITLPPAPVKPVFVPNEVIENVEMTKMQVSHEDISPIKHESEFVLEPTQDDALPTLLEAIHTTPPVPSVIVEPEKEITPLPALVKPVFVPEEVIENVEMTKMQVSHEDIPSVEYKPEPIFEPIQDDTILPTPHEYVSAVPPVPLVSLEVCEPKKETIIPPLVRDGIAGIVRPPAKPVFVPEKVVEHVEIKSASAIREHVYAPGMHGVAQGVASKLDFRSPQNKRIAETRVVLPIRESNNMPETNNGLQPIHLKKRTGM